LIDLIMIAAIFVIWVFALWRDLVINTGPIRKTIRVDRRDVECDDCWREQLWKGVTHQH
jgi:hypothetical protein